MSIDDEIKQAFTAHGLREPAVQRHGDIWLAGYLDDRGNGPCVAMTSLDVVEDSSRAARIDNAVRTFVANGEGTHTVIAAPPSEEAWIRRHG